MSHLIRRSVLLATIAVSLVLGALATSGASADPVAPRTVSAATAKLFGLPQPTAGAAAADAARIAAAQGTCSAQILDRTGKLQTLTTTTYKYKFKRLKGGKFRRVIVRVKVAVRVSCAKQCVKVVKKKGKYKSVYTVRKVKVKIKKRGRIVTVKRRKRVYKFTDCKNIPNIASLGSPVSVTILPGSYANLDFGAFKRQAGVTGKLRGFLIGKPKPNTDTPLTLNRGELRLAKTAVFIDDACNGQVSAAIQTGNPTAITLDQKRPTTATLFAAGTVTSIAYVVIRLPLELRNEDTGCNDQYIRTGYTEFTQTFFLRGKVGAGGLQKLPLTSPPDVLNVTACLVPGIPTQPCNGLNVPIPILVDTKLTVAVDLSGK